MTPTKRTWSLSLSAIAILVIVYGVNLYQPHGAFAPSKSASSQSDSIDEETIRSSEDKSERADDGGEDRDQTEGPEDTEAHRGKDTADKDSEDEAYVREMVRNTSIEKTQERYSLLIEMLELTPAEIDALFEFLVEDAIASTRTKYSDGLGLDEDERLARLQEILSDEKLQRFLAYERNLADFRELQSVQSMLQQKGVPLTEAQRDGLLEILIDVQKQLDPERPSHIEHGSMEDFEYSLSQLDEYDRLVTELASSVLSATQVEYMFERNQKYSYERASQLEWHKQRLAANPDDDMPLWYVPKGD
jgi:hypothetical protein